MSDTNTPPTPFAVRGTVAVCRDLGIPGWFIERVIREEGLVIRRIGNSRAWSDADVERLRAALVRREERKAARRKRRVATPSAPPSPRIPPLDPADLEHDLRAECEADESSTSNEAQP